MGKRRKKYDVTIITRKDGRKQTKITFSGKRFTITAKDEKTIYQKIEELEKRDVLGIINNTSISVNETVMSYIIKWFKSEKEGKVSYSTEQRYRTVINLYIIPFMGYMPLNEVKQIHVQGLINSMNDKSWSYQSKVIDTLRQMFDSAIINGLIVTNPVMRIQKNGIKQKEKEPLTQQQISILLSSLTDARQKIFVYLALFCGLRKGEIFALNWKDDIDFLNRRIIISKSLCFESNQSYIKEPKTAAGRRIVAMPHIVYELMLENRKENGFVITDTRGNQMTKSSARRFWLGILQCIQKPVPNGQAYCEEKDIRNNTLFYVTPHILRHTYCTNLYYAGIDLQSASKLMGHSSIEITDSVYTHLDTSYADIAIPKLDTFWDNYYKNGCESGCKYYEKQ